MAGDDSKERDFDPLAHAEAGLLPEYERLLAECPVAHTDRFDGFWMLTKYADVVEASIDYKRYRSGTPFVDMRQFRDIIPHGLNPPIHTVYRRHLQNYFTPERLQLLEPALRRHTAEQLGPILSRGRGDLATEYARVLSARVLAFVMQMDEATPRLLEHMEKIYALGGDGNKINEFIFGTFAREVEALIADRRKNPRDPATDLISGTIALEIDGKPIAHENVFSLGLQMFAAGYETSTRALTGTFYTLATHPEIQERLRRDPAQLPTAIEEFVRLHPSQHLFARELTEETEIRGRRIPAGATIALNFAAANRDPEEFPNPGVCDITREPNRHLSFGHGVHKCVGIHVARLNLRIAVEELLARTKSFELDGKAVRIGHIFGEGFASVPVRVET